MSLSLAQCELGNIVMNKHRHGAKEWAEGSRASWEADRRNSFFIFFNFLRESMYLMAQKIVWLPRQAA